MEQYFIGLDYGSDSRRRRLPRVVKRCLTSIIYSIFFDFNKECVLGKGSAIFFHCYSSRRYTSGCVAVSEDDMKKIMVSVDMDARIIIQDFPALSY